MSGTPKAVKKGVVTQEQWDSLSASQRKHFNRTWNRARNSGIDYWDFIKLSKGERIAANLPERTIWDENRIAYIRDAYERNISTERIAKHFGCAPDVIRSHAGANGIYRKDFRVKFTRVEFSYPKQETESTSSRNRRKKNRFYVYAYLRTDGTPYYIGKGQLNRAFDPHLRPGPKGGVCNHTPRDPNRIRLLQTHLTEKKSLEWEVDLISILGTIEQGTGCLLNFTSGGDGMKDPTPSTRRRISEKAKQRGMPSVIYERAQEAAKARTCEKYDIPLEEYEAMSSEQRVHCLGWLRYNSEKTYEDYKLFTELPEEERLRRTAFQNNLSSLRKSSEKWKVPFCIWAMYDNKTKAAMRGYIRCNPQVTAMDYLSGKYSKFQSTKEGLAHQKMAGAKAAIQKQKIAAEKWGMEYEEYSNKSPQELSAMKSWARRHPGKNGNDYFKAKESASVKSARRAVQAAIH